MGLLEREAITAASHPFSYLNKKFPLKNIITPNFIFKEWHFMKETEIKTTLSADWAGLPSATF